MIHLHSHAEVDRTLPVGEAIRVNTDCTYWLLWHQGPDHPHTRAMNRPAVSELADRDSWRDFNLEALRRLPVIGNLAAPLLDATGQDFTPQATGIPSYPRWRPAVFAMRGPLPTSLSEEPAIGYEVGVGAYHVRDGNVSSAMGCFAITLRHERTAVDGISHGYELRTYRGFTGPETLLGATGLLADEACHDFLQMQRNAMWNTATEPI